jgi:hypothetical protein
MGRQIRAGTVAALIVIALLALLWRSERRPQFDPNAVLMRVQQLNQLATVKYTIQKIVGLKDDKFPVGSESILLIMQANVEGGIDLSSMHNGDVSVQPDGGVIVRLPEPRILNISIDEKETKVWDRQKTWWTPWIPYSLDLEQRARLAGLETVKKTALDMGILDQAERNAETSIRGLLGLAGVKSVRIVPWKAT